MEKKWIFRRALYLLIFLPTLLFAQERPLITVLPFSSIEVSDSISMIIGQLFETNLVNTGAYSVLSQNERDQILSAQTESLSGCSDEACAIEIGRLLSAENLIMGTVAALGTKYIITAKIIDVTTSRTLGAENISASSIEELDTACYELTLRLVRRAMPDFDKEESNVAEEPVTEETSEDDLADEAADAARAAEEAAAAVEEAEEEEKPKKPKRVWKPGDFSVPGYATLVGGIVVQAGGNIAGAVAQGYRINSLYKYDEYMADESGGESFYSDYLVLMDAYSFQTIMSYSLWGAGTAAQGTSWMVYPSVNLSLPGQIVYSVGVVSGFAGNLFNNMSVNRMLEAYNSYGDYLADESGGESFYEDYETFINSSSINRIMSLSLWGAGSIMQAAAPFIPGDQRSAAPSLLNQIFYTVGAMLTGFGNYMGATALTERIDAQIVYDDYMAANDSVTTEGFYDDYIEILGSYEDKTYISVGAVALGSALSITSLFLPLGGGTVETTELPLSFTVTPASYGIGAQINLQF